MMLADIAAGSTARRNWWKVPLALSLVLNLFFVGGALWIRVHAPPPLSPEQRLERIGGQLGLDAGQQRAFAQYSQTVHGLMQSMHQAVQPMFANAWAEIGKPHADEATVMQLFDQADQERRRYMRQLTSATLSFLATLSPEQRAKFVQLARPHNRHWPHPSRHDAGH